MRGVKWLASESKDGKTRWALVMGRFIYCAAGGTQ